MAADKARSIFLFLLAPMTQIAQLALPVGLKMLVDGVSARDTRNVWIAVVLISATAALSSFAVTLQGSVGHRVDDETNQLIEERVITITAGLPGMELHERPEYSNNVALLSRHYGVFGRALVSVVSNLALVFRMIMTAILLTGIHPLLLLLPLFGLPSLWGAGVGQRILRKAEEASVETVRRTRHLFEIATSASAGKELRVFGLGGVLTQRHRVLWDRQRRQLGAAQTKSLAVSTAASMVFTLGFISTLTFVAMLVVRGRATPGDLIMAITIASQVNGQVALAAAFISWLATTARAVGRFLWLLEYQDPVASPKVDVRGTPRAIRKGLVLRDVSFSYPGTARPALSDVDLTIPAGSSVAIVGENGAGKTSLVKLLCRFYDPTSGSISVDDVDLRSFDPVEWQKHVSAVYQDFAKLELTVRETVGVGDLERLNDPAAVATALSEAEATDFVNALPKGADTQLGRSFGGGVELSGGQWQRLALARGMMPHHPLLLVLDEPSASLDPQAEYNLFGRYAAAASRAAEASGTITILVSHRFSTVGMADLIVVLEGGRVLEVGPHHDLMRNGGLYAELFELQAQQYR